MSTILSRTNRSSNDVIGPAVHVGPATLYSASDEVAAKYERIARLRAAQQAKLAERKAEAERRFAERMAQPVDGERPEMVQVRAGDVMFDRRYQTDDRYDEGRAKHIAEIYDKNECDPIKINIRPGDPTQTIWGWDGRHRVNATIFRLGPDERMNAMLIRVRYEREAELFARQHDNEKRVAHPIKFNALVQAGDPEAMAVRALADRLGLTLGRRARERTMAANSFLECCRIKGLEATEEGLGYVLAAWDGSGDSLEAHVAKGVVWFVANRRDDPNYDRRRVRTIINRETVARLEKDATRYKGLPGHEAIAAVVVDLYNRTRPERLCLAAWKARGER